MVVVFPSIKIALTDNRYSSPPPSQAILKRRCIPLTQVMTVVFALVGAILITRPNFLFHHSDHDPLKYPNLFRAYGIAFVAGILAGMQYIFLAFCPNVHWSVWQVRIVRECTGLYNVDGSLISFRPAPPLPLIYFTTLQLDRIQRKCLGL